jgi:hypothetical protein
MALITMRETEFKKRLEDPGTFATVLLAILIDEYSTDCFEWEPQALFMQIKEDFHVDVPDVNRDKIGAMMTALTTNQFFQNTEVFTNTCKALSHVEADFSVFRPLTPEEMAWGVTEVVLNNPPAKHLGNEEFSDEIGGLVGMLLFDQGVLQPPKSLKFATYSTTNPVEDIQTMFADDESMFSAAMANQKEASESVDTVVKEQLGKLKHQLETLPLSSKQSGGNPKAPAARQ